TWKARMNLALAVVVILSGLIFLNRAALLTGFPVSTRAVARALSGGSQAVGDLDFTVAPDGVAEVPLVIQEVRYFPESVVIPADRPVRLIVDRREDSACSDRLVIPGLGIDAALAPNGVTQVQLPPAKEGTYPMTCGMGMMSGEIVARNP
ncbi:MAG: cupredoxin domain-containing protein, partial [Coriobacteriia bacterium]